jgi:hypothetical protein
MLSGTVSHRNPGLLRYVASGIWPRRARQPDTRGSLDSSKESSHHGVAHQSVVDQSEGPVVRLGMARYIVSNSTAGGPDGRPEGEPVPAEPVAGAPGRDGGGSNKIKPSPPLGFICRWLRIPISGLD